MSSRRPAPTQTTSPSPQSCSPITLIRLSTRSRTACASRESSLWVVKDVHSGFWPTPSVFRYEIRYLGIGRSASFDAHEPGEAREQVARVVRPLRCLGVVLHGEDGPLAVPHALARAVVQVQVGRLPARGRERRGVHGEAVVLGGDLDAPG